jgi:hypothetical protein
MIRIIVHCYLIRVIFSWQGLNDNETLCQFFMLKIISDRVAYNTINFNNEVTDYVFSV